MNERYANSKITEIFSDKYKLELWQKTEFAVMQARVELGLMGKKDCETIITILKNNPIDIEWWKRRDKEIHHDLNAFIDERVRHLGASLHQHFHKGITSYDTEEPAFARVLIEAANILEPLSTKLKNALVLKATTYRYTIMNARTHGQEAEMMSFGSRALSWLNDYRVAEDALIESLRNLYFSKLSGAIGKYGSLDPRIEKIALDILGFKPYVGVTQIMPRILYAPIAQSLSNLVSVLDKIAGDIRLAARSGNPIMQEPFQKKQKGSSAMPQKKNTIRTEQVEGMARMARGYMLMISENIKTWEERAIEQSSVERVAWPDLFHVTVQALKVMEMVLSGLKVYPDNMLREIYQSRGVYASSEAKEFLKEAGLSHEDAYRIVQLACFNVFEPSEEMLAIREIIPSSFAQASELLERIDHILPFQKEIISIKEYIPMADLRISENLDITQEEVDRFNEVLRSIFDTDETLEVMKEWYNLFTPEYLLRNEEFLYQNTELGIEEIFE